MNWRNNLSPLLLLAVGFSALVGVVLGGDSLSPPYNLIKLKVDMYILPVLKYDKLEPYIDEKTVDVHLYGHHEAYRTKMTNALKEWKKEDPDNEFAFESILEIIRNLDKVPEKYRTQLTNNGGGFVNHCFYWGCMMPNKNITQRQPTASLMKEIEETFESYENFQEEFTQSARSVFGSGYVWLSRKPLKDGAGLIIHKTANQDSPVSNGLFPILVIDVWEHAYYLQYQHRRGDYINQWWEVVDWANVDALDAWWKTVYPGEAKKEEL